MLAFVGFGLLLGRDGSAWAVLTQVQARVRVRLAVSQSRVQPTASHLVVSSVNF
ncbi:hypothetical protein ACFXCZ_14835 [Streptomyces sp. NPDC059396]|uniref:hypothetical protein n=1 Tax=Streptomyces sp. NPDC059396 TaxID=3346819 RepID=UPI0036C9E0EC